MQPLSQRRIGQGWLQLAQDDLAGAAVLLRSSALHSRLCGYFCQQAAEKALKGAIALTGSTPDRIHDLVELAALLESRGAVPPITARQRVTLSLHAVVFKYEMFIEADRYRADLADHLAAAQACVAWLEALIAATPE